jgi:tetratricopeptide (TPR) repeat protein
MRPILIGLLLFAAACSRNPQDTARQFVESGDRFAREGRDDAALIEYRNALREQPDWGEVHEKMGDTLDRMGRRAEAYRSYAAAARIVDGRPLPEGEEELRTIVAKSPGSAASRLALAETLLARDETAEAETELTAAVSADPNNELAIRSLAALYLRVDKKAEAEDLLKKAATLRPSRYRSELALADFMIDEQRYPEARQVLEALRRRGAFAEDVALRLAAIDYAEGRTEDAQSAVAELIAAHTSAQAWTLQADFLFREGKLTEALAATHEALTLDPQLSAASRLADNIRKQQLGR